MIVPHEAREATKKNTEELSDRFGQILGSLISGWRLAGDLSYIYGKVDYTMPLRDHFHSPIELEVCY
jgi:hypothetical protein